MIEKARAEVDGSIPVGNGDFAPKAQDAPWPDADFPSFNFDMIEGLTGTVDLAAPLICSHRGQVIAPLARRIVGLSHHGQPLHPAQGIVLTPQGFGCFRLHL